MARMSSLLVSSLLLFVLLLLVLHRRPAMAASASQLSAEAATLLQFKAHLIDNYALLSRWNSANVDSLCSWESVICSAASSTVIGLNFTNMNLNGTLTPPLCDLPNVSLLYLRFNNFKQPFPAWLPESCPHLTVLDLSQNWFYGQLPSNISKLVNLEFLSLEGNSFEGPVPPEFGSLPRLTFLRLRGNAISGIIPEQLGNLSSLETLDLAYAGFSPGRLPPEFGNLTRLQFLNLETCNLVGPIPPSFGNLLHLSILDLANNSLSGHIPPSLTRLTNLSYMYLFENLLSGPIPPSISNLTNLVELAFDGNALEGSVPDGIAHLSGLQLLHLFDNNLSGFLPDGLADLRNLSNVILYNNHLTGSIPPRWGELSSLQHFDLSYNLFNGSVPPSLCNHGTLVYLSLQENLLSGEIPVTYGSCNSVTRFQLHSNQLSGTVPTDLWSLPSLTVLMLHNNRLSGNIRLQTGSNVSMQVLSIDNNQFDGPLAAEINRYWNLSKFSASQNKLFGPLPPQIGSLSGLTVLNLSQNSLSGSIPDTIANCNQLTSLSLSENRLAGPIPVQLSEISDLTYLDLSRNHLNGTIPTALGRSNFVLFDVSYNNLSGPVPNSLAANFRSTIFEGNPALCLPDEPCALDNRSAEKAESSRSKEAKLVLFIVIGIVATAINFVVCLRFYSKRKAPRNKADWKVISFQRINFKEEELFTSLDEKNVIGCGSSGRVYKVLLPGGQTLAVKKLLCPAGIMGGVRGDDLAWNAEIEILGKIKHQNIVKLLCSCVSDEGKLLVYEYMPKGSLGDLLHRCNAAPLQWSTRFRIALGAAEALQYLHHDCEPQILHRDVKSNNILLNYDYEAKLADFGVAKSVQRKHSPMTGVVGSVGYIAPEYAYTLKVDEKSDVYSYGVVLLELVTGKSPAEQESEGVDLVRWVEREVHSKESVWKVMDGRIVEKSDKESMLMVLKIALHCTSKLPQRRPSMREVAEFLMRAKPKVGDAHDHAPAEKPLLFMD